MDIIETIKEAWSWIGIEPEVVVRENDFGNLLIQDIHGRYWRLCPEEVYCQVVAENQEELAALTRNHDFLEDWYMINLVEQAKEKFGPLQPGNKYHFVIPGVLGGEYGVANIRSVPQIEQIRFSGDVGWQIEELPDGAQIKLKTIA